MAQDSVCHFRMFFGYMACFLSLFCFSQTTAQEVKLRGMVSDSSGNALPNANIIAFSTEASSKTKFTISGENGEFGLSLIRNVAYNLEISYLGFEKIATPIHISQDTIRKFILIPNTEQLKEVEVNYKIPVVIKPDTIIYNVEAFATGQERKLKELLNNLPGIEVDRDGNVTAQGTRISKVLVEGDIFFNGDSKMAVTNIPADVVDQIEVIDNYNEIAFLKGFSDSDNKALNIKLKKDRQRFSFGEVEVGGGIQERYLAHPSIFRYGPNMNATLIGDFSNIGTPSFTFDDFVDFRGESAGNLLEDRSMVDKKVDAEMESFLRPQNVKSLQNNLLAFSHKQQLSPKWRFNSFLILDQSIFSTLAESFNDYLYGTDPVREKRVNSTDVDNRFGLGKITMSYVPSNEETLILNLHYKTSKSDKNGLLSSVTDTLETRFITPMKLTSNLFNPNLEYYKRFSLSQTFSAILDWSTESFDHSDFLSSTSQFLSGYLPWETADVYRLNQVSNLRKDNLNLIVKDFWVLNPTNHLYSTFEYSRRYETYFTTLSQLTDPQGTGWTSNDDYLNDLGFLTQDLAIGLEYKFLLHDLTAKIGASVHDLSWKITQNNTVTTTQSTQVFPKLSANYRFNSGEFISFQFNVLAKLPGSNDLAVNPIVENFNSVFMGNPGLTLQRSKSYLLRYSKFNFLKGISLSSLFSYQVQTDPIKRQSSISGIEQFSLPINYLNTDKSLLALFRFNKRLQGLEYTLQASSTYNEFWNEINASQNLNISRAITGIIKLKSRFDKTPNFEIGYSVSPRGYSNNTSTINFWSSSFDIGSSFNHEGLQMQFDFTNTNFLNRDSESRTVFNIANSKVGYQKEDSPWYFEIEGRNIFNNTFVRSSSITQFLVQDNRTFVLPRMILFKVAYKL